MDGGGRVVGHEEHSVRTEGDRPRRAERDTPALQTQVAHDDFLPAGLPGTIAILRTSRGWLTPVTREMWCPPVPRREPANATADRSPMWVRPRGRRAPGRRRAPRGSGRSTRRS